MSEHAFADSLEELLTEFADMLQANRATQWTLGDMLARAREEFGPGVLGQFAEVARVTKRWCQRLARVSETFSESERAAYPDLGWSVFAVAAGTDDPIGWLQRAADNGWSEAQLRQAIRGAKPETPKVARLLKQAEKILQAGGDDADALEDGMRNLLRLRG